MSLITLIIPTYNEANIIPVLYQRLVKAMDRDFPSFDWEVIFVDDGSNDNTLNCLHGLHNQDARVKAICFSRNFGHHIAISAGLDAAHGDLIVLMDGDLQDQPEEMIKLYRQLQKGYDVVFGIRKIKKFGWLKRLTSAGFNHFIKLMVQEEIVINSTIFRMMTRQVVDNLKQMREQNRYVVGMIGWVGFKHSGAVVKHGERYSGKSKYSLYKQLQLAANAIVSFSDFPLKLASRVGIVLVGISVILMFWILLQKILYNTPLMGWTSLFGAIVFMGGVQIVILGIMGEYLGRNYIESKHRPLYIIKESVGDDLCPT